MQVVTVNLEVDSCYQQSHSTLLTPMPGGVDGFMIICLVASKFCRWHWRLGLLGCNMPCACTGLHMFRSSHGIANVPCLLMNWQLDSSCIMMADTHIISNSFRTDIITTICLYKQMLPCMLWPASVIQFVLRKVGPNLLCVSIEGLRCLELQVSSAL